MLSIDVSEDIENRLENVAKNTGKTKSYCARIAILEYLEEIEDTNLAMDRLGKPDKIWTQKEIEEEFCVAN
jgi:RHH-type rel operon transcriptional repressor/antitoxin RelB